MTLARRVVAEGVGTAMLVAAVVGSGIMGERLADGSVALALLANTVATGAALVALILAFGPISGAHFNPAVTLASASQGDLAWSDAQRYVAAQVVGALVGVAIGNLMFGEPAFALSRHARHGSAQLLSEFVATFGLLSVIWGCSRLRASAVVPFAVGAYITAAYWFTASTSFANPAVTIARCLTNTFAGIRPADVPGFIVAQLIGAAAATTLFRWLVPRLPAVPTHRGAGDRGPAKEVPMTTAIFACVHNAGRSQMAAAFFNALADATKARAVSAGTEPAACVHPEVVSVMREIGMDLSHAQPQRLTDELAASAQLLVTMGCGEQCPVVPGLRRDDWQLQDPKGLPHEDVRAIRDDIRRRVVALLGANGWDRS